MSIEARWNNKRILTIWRKGPKDRYGEFDYLAPEHFLCSIQAGGKNKYTDKMGIEFTPKESFWTEFMLTDGRTFGEPATYGDKMAFGEFTGVPIATALDIKSIAIYDSLSANFEPDYLIAG